MNQPRCVPIWIQKDQYLQKTAPSLLKETSYKKARFSCGVYLFTSQRLTGYRSGLNPGFLAVRNRNWDQEKEGNMKSGCWSLPKGTLDMGEDEFDCALRELWEETGINLRSYPCSWEVVKEEQCGRKTLFYVELFDLRPFQKVVPLDMSEIDGIFWMEDKYPIAFEKWNSFSKLFLLPDDSSSEDNE